MNHYEAKLEEKRQRLEAAAEKKRAEAVRVGNQNNALLDAMAGTPILVGHHSEKRHRRDRDKIWNDWGRAVKMEREADELERRAAAVGTAGISHEDPEAVVKLKAEIAEKEAIQARMKEINAHYRKHGTLPSGKELPPAGPGFEDKPYPSYALTNNSANIRRMKKRLASLEAEAKRQEAGEMEPIEGEAAGVGYEIVEEEDRFAVYFVKRPPDEVTAAMRSNGWRWAKSRGAWLRFRNQATRYAIPRTVEALNKLEG